LYALIAISAVVIVLPLRVSDSYVCSPSWHRLGPLHVALVAKRCRHGAVAVPEARRSLVTTCPRRQRAQPQQPDRTYHQIVIGWRGVTAGFGR